MIGPIDKTFISSVINSGEAPKSYIKVDCHITNFSTYYIP